VRRPLRTKKEEPSSPHWMTTFSDMMTLILVFFVLLFALSQVDIIKFQAFLLSFQGGGVLDWGDKPLEEVQPEAVPPAPGPSPGAEPTPPTPEYTLMEVYEMVSQTLVEAGLEDQIGLRFEEAGVALDIPDRVLFDTAKADLKPEAKAVLDPLADLFRRLPFEIHVEGHTDSRPISTVEFPSNWELSGARASRVIRYFVDAHDLDPRKFVAVGYGEYRPVAPNDTEANMQLNRRVVMVIRAKEAVQREVLAIE